MRDIYLIFGENTNLCQLKEEELKKAKTKERYQMVFIDCRDNNALQKMLSPDLFATKRFLIIKNISKLNPSDQEKLVLELKKDDGPEVLITAETIPVKISKEIASKAKLFEYKYPHLIYRFLESYYPGNEKNAFKLLREVLKNEQPEFVFVLLARHIIDLINILKPKVVIPGHGGHDKTKYAIELAKDLGYIKGKNIHMLSNGQKIKLR